MITRASNTARYPEPDARLLAANVDALITAARFGLRANGAVGLTGAQRARASAYWRLMEALKAAEGCIDELREGGQ